MNAIEYIQKNIDPIKVLSYYDFECMTEGEDCIRAKCKIHGGDNPTAFVWNKNNNLWFCYTGENCGGGDIFTLIEKMEDVPFLEAVKIASKILSIDIKNMSIGDTSDERMMKKHKKWLLKQLEYINRKPFKDYNISYTKHYETNVNFTRFDTAVIKFYDSFFCNIYPTEAYIHRNKLVIPLKFKQHVVGVALRDTANSVTCPKWFYHPKGIKLSNMLYNYDNAVKELEKGVNDIIIVEGIFDVWAYHRIGIDNVVALLGSSISDEQFKLILQLGVDVICSLDNDNAGNKCKNKIISLFKSKAKIYSVNLPEGEDPASITKDELMTCYLNRNKM